MRGFILLQYQAAILSLLTTDVQGAELDFLCCMCSYVRMRNSAAKD